MNLRGFGVAFLQLVLGKLFAFCESPISSANDGRAGFLGDGAVRRQQRFVPVNGGSFLDSEFQNRFP